MCSAITSATGPLTCPACGQATSEADPIPAALRSGPDQLCGQLENLTAARPSQRNALTALDTRAAALREELAAAQAALNALQPLVESNGCGFDLDPIRPELLVIKGRSAQDTLRLGRAVLASIETFRSLG